MQDDVLGFGLPLTQEQRDQLNIFRRTKYPAEWFLEANSDKEYYKEVFDADNTTPGMRFLNYGKNKDGYWTYAHLSRQTDDVLDLYECLFTQYQIIGEYDWSSGHSKAREIALNSLTMNVKWGGKQPRMRTSEKLDEHCVGNGEAFM